MLASALALPLPSPPAALMGLPHQALSLAVLATYS